MNEEEKETKLVEVKNEGKKKAKLKDIFMLQIVIGNIYIINCFVPNCIRSRIYVISIYIILRIRNGDFRGVCNSLATINQKI